jgi:hypothetical protein
MPEPLRYVSDDEDSGRWNGFPFREGDIVISTRSKSGTTWMQMICALLIFQTPELPDRLSSLSPWVDWLITPREDVLKKLEAQSHRRFVKTHTPLDGVPLDSRATYIVVGRHPLDMAVSLYHQSNNINRARVRELTGRAREPDQPERPRPSLHDWLLKWIDAQRRPEDEMDSLNGVMWHLSDAWQRRTEPPQPSAAGPHSPAIVLVHYDDLSADLEGQMRHLAGLLGIDVPEHKWPELVHAARFEQMRATAVRQAPDTGGVLKDPGAFFRRGYSGAGAEVLSADELAGYYARTSRLGPPDLLNWLHRVSKSETSGVGTAAAG